MLSWTGRGATFSGADLYFSNREKKMSNAASASATAAQSSADSSAKRAASRSIRLPGEDLSLNEMLRVMDVAREFRKNRDVAEEMFRRDEVRVELRAKLMRSAKLAGDRVSESEIDAAIDQYLATLNTYQDPKPGFQNVLAHAWVWRKRIVAGVAAVAITLGGAYYLFFSSAAPFSPTVQANRAVAAEQETASVLVDRIIAMAKDPAVIEQAKSLQAEINTARGEDVTSAIAAREKLAQLVDQLSTNYEAHILNKPNQTSAFERLMPGKTPLHYVIVEARDSAGNVIPQMIRDVETGKVEQVTQWAEQVPRDVYLKLKQDKQSDGLLNQTLFSSKTRGELQPKIQLTGTANVPITAGNRLTAWPDRS